MFDPQRTTAVDAAKVTCPVLVVSGSDDKVISPVTGRKVAALYANATFEEDPGRGHFLIMEDGRRQARRPLRRLDRRGHQMSRRQWPRQPLRGYDRRRGAMAPRSMR